MTHAPEPIETARLVLQRPRPHDGDAIFGRYASDPDVTRYLSWSLHVSLDHTRAFLASSDEEWRGRFGPPDRISCRRQAEKHVAVRMELGPRDQ